MLYRLIAWHQQRAKDCLGLIERAPYIPEPELTMLSEMALFHEAAARLLMTYELQGQKQRQH
jgi:hypothetical protein